MHSQKQHRCKCRPIFVSEQRKNTFRAPIFFIVFCTCSKKRYRATGYIIGPLQRHVTARELMHINVFDSMLMSGVRSISVQIDLSSSGGTKQGWEWSPSCLSNFLSASRLYPYKTRIFHRDRPPKSPPVKNSSDSALILRTTFGKKRGAHMFAPVHTVATPL